jgi:hypothetical protein
MKNWIKSLKEKSCGRREITESLVLSEIPSELTEDWENFMRGKTCPILENGDRGVYSWDLQQFLDKQDHPYPTFAGSWDDKSYDEILIEKELKFSHIIGSCDVEPCTQAYKRDVKDFAFYHKPTKLWVYFLPNYEQRRVISLALKNDASTFREHKKEYFTELLKSCSFNGTKEYAKSNFLEFECKGV